MGSNGASSIKVRSTPPKDQASSSSLQEIKKDSSTASSETSSVSEENITAQEIPQIKSNVTMENVITSQTRFSSVELFVNERKENVNSPNIEEAANTNATGKRKKPKSKITIYLHLLEIQYLGKFWSM